MKKSILWGALLLWSIGSVQAQQQFSGKAVYESKRDMSKLKVEGNSMTPEIQQRILEQMKKNMEKTFVLDFDKTTSLYKEEEKLESPLADAGSGVRVRVSTRGGNLYKNVKEKRYVDENEIFGKEFLIKDALTDWKWEMSSETKMIGDYTCYKATAIRNKIAEPKPKDKKSVLNLEETEPKEVRVTAWYTPDIPVSQGPDDYWGLPGLILEVSDGNTTILCSKIVLNPKEKTQIKEPTKGKVVTQNEYDTILRKKAEETFEVSKNEKGKTVIRIGG
ncbi:GLPGLI family protein [Flavobacterium cerinum]|uniref:GLPGLI family protein n=1 Tax=Flavobacterium cerinum TaxID=2502784 RepID=A0ABY5IVH9_9FLAO|nr:GLPGLI family protein [Flavobacterium cerinum]UUC46810.1 GLPGLI family protein [Flavobacterium cerinum]